MGKKKYNYEVRFTTNPDTAPCVWMDFVNSDSELSANEIIKQAREQIINLPTMQGYTIKEITIACEKKNLKD